MKALMNSIAFIDTEIEPKSLKVLDIGSVKDNGSSFHNTSVAELYCFLTGHNSFADTIFSIMT